MLTLAEIVMISIFIIALTIVALVKIACDYNYKVRELEKRYKGSEKDKDTKDIQEFVFMKNRNEGNDHGRD